VTVLREKSFSTAATTGVPTTEGTTEGEITTTQEPISSMSAELKISLLDRKLYQYFQISFSFLINFMVENFVLLMC